MSFWKSIFGKKEEEKVDFITANTPNPVVAYINADGTYDYYHSHKDVLKFFYDNKEIFAKTVLPMLDICKNIGFSRSDLITAISDSMKFLTRNSVLENFKQISQGNNIKRNRLFTEIERKFENPYEVDSVLWGLDFEFTCLRSYLMNEELSNKIIASDSTVWKKDEVYKSYYKHMLTVAIAKTFLYTKVIALIEKEEELSKILNNAYKKYQDVDEVVEKTYDIFFDYIKISKQYFTKDDYNLCVMRIVYGCSYSLYTLEELQLESDIQTAGFSEIIDDIIANKRYKGKDIDILFKSVLCEKMPYTNNLLDFLYNMDLFDGFQNRIQKATEKEDLLNNDYDDVEDRLTIVDIDLMSGIEFENFLCSFFSNHGYECSTTKASGDQGIDLIAEKDGVVIAIQAKCYTGTVGNHAVMEAFAGMKYYKANRCMVITNSTFSKSAIDLAQANGVILWDRQILIEKLNGIYE